MDLRARSEMDITPVFGTDIGGSSPSGRIREHFDFSAISIRIVPVLFFMRGYRLVVGHVLAKDEVGVRFSLPAFSETRVFGGLPCLYVCG